MPKQFQAEYLPYSQTKNFSKIVLDYVAGAEGLKSFYEHEVSLDRNQSSYSAKKKISIPTDNCW